MVYVRHKSKYLSDFCFRTEELLVGTDEDRKGHGPTHDLRRDEPRALSASKSLVRTSMDIHRSRFVPYPPATITSLAFSHVFGTNRDRTNDVRLAIGRANGDIELWNPLRGDWVQENIFHGGRARTVDGLAWTQEPDEILADKIIDGRLRIFSVGYSNSITEWDLLSGLPLRDASGGSSAIWCLSPQPRLNKEEKENEDGFIGQNLVAGCADGSLILFSTAEGDLQFQRYITRAPTKKAQALSITFQNRHTIIAGYANSFMRVHDIRNGSLLRNITLGGGLPGAPKETLVWQVKCLPWGDIVSGTSNGEIQIWDGKNYSQRQRIAGHKSDILALTTSPDGQTIFSGGTDMHIVMYKQDTRQRWAKVYNEKIHKHEIKALAAYQDRKIDVVASGGIDGSPGLMPIREFGNEYSRTLPRLPQQSPVMSSPSQRLLATWWNREVLLWRIGPSENREDLAKKNWKLLYRLVMKGEENISSTSLSDDGKLLAVSTVAEVKVFHLRTKTSGERALRVQKIRVPAGLDKGGRLVQFSPGNKWLAVVSNASDVNVGRIMYEDAGSDEIVTVLSETVALRRMSKPSRVQDGLNGTWGAYSRTIAHLAFSSDSSVLVATDLGGSFDSWVLEGREDSSAAPTVKATPNGTSHSASSLDSGSDDDEDDDEDARPVIISGQHWVHNKSNDLLPTLDSAPLILSFRPSVQPRQALVNGHSAASSTTHDVPTNSNEKSTGEHRLLVVTAKHQIYELDVLKGQLTDWSRRNPTNSFPARWRKIMDRVMGCVWDVSGSPRKERLWMYGTNWLAMFDLSRDFHPPKHAESAKAQSGTHDETGNREHKGKKRKRGAEDVVHELKQLSGAGGKIKNNKDRENVGFGQQVKTIVGTGTSASVSISPEKEKTRKPEDQVQSKEIEEDDRVELPRTRDVAHDETGTNGALVKIEQDNEKEQHGPRWWMSFEYRSILGVVPIGFKDDDDQPLEVVLVERPLWDLDLPPRFAGPHDRD